MNKFKLWIIHKLGGITQKEQVITPQIVNVDLTPLYVELRAAPYYITKEDIEKCMQGMLSKHLDIEIEQYSDYNGVVYRGKIMLPKEYVKEI